MRIAIAHDIRDFVGWQSYSQTTKRLGDEVAYIRTDDCFAATYELAKLIRKVAKKHGLTMVELGAIANAYVNGDLYDNYEEKNREWLGDLAIWRKRLLVCDRDELLEIHRKWQAWNVYWSQEHPDPEVRAYFLEEFVVTVGHIKQMEREGDDRA